MQCINLIIQYVNDDRPARQAEYDQCVRRNLANPYVKSIHELQESADVHVPDEFVSHPKFRRHPLNRWMTFQDAFTYCNATLSDEVCGIVNLDIFLDSMTTDWRQMSEALKQKVVFCLSRMEFNPDGSAFIDPELLNIACSCAQDAWLFRAPIDVPNCDFGVGTMGSDNAVAHRILTAGYLPINAPQKFRIFHYDRARGKTVQNQIEFYKTERKTKGQTTHPEREGQYLLPDMDMIRSVDELLRQLNATDLQRYSVICELFNRCVKVNSPAV